jgi:hypothetical protein
VRDDSWGWTGPRNRLRSPARLRFGCRPARWLDRDPSGHGSSAKFDINRVGATLANYSPGGKAPNFRKRIAAIE